MQPNLLKHITSTYINLRVGMAGIAFALPFLLMAGSWISTNVIFQGSISGFYHTPMRNLFVGAMVAVGCFLYLYKGFSDSENFALNIAGLAALGVAFFPTSVPEVVANNPQIFLPEKPFVAPLLHYTSAALLFFAIAYVCIFSGRETVALIKDESSKKYFTMIYKVIGALMLVLPVVTFLFSYFTVKEYWIFIVEFVAILIFAFFWWTKAKELDHHEGIDHEPMNLERKLMQNDSKSTG
jgi:uncharacterized membrane protein